MMFFALIMAIWFVVFAYSSGRRWFIWGSVGAAVGLALSTVLGKISPGFLHPLSLYRSVPYLIVAATLAMVIVVVARFLSTSHFIEDMKDMPAQAGKRGKSVICSVCGSTIPAQAHTCPKCGQRRVSMRD